MSEYPFVILISNQDRSIIGTGFAIHKTEQSTFLLTCAHVAKQIDGDVHAVDKPAEIVVSGDNLGIDLAVLQIGRQELDIQVLSLAGGGKIGNAFTSSGFSHLTAKDPINRDIEGYLADRFRIPAKIGAVEGFVGWDVDIDGSGVLADGYSGAPILERESGKVIAVVTTMQPGGKRGQAISVEALSKLLSDSDSLSHPAIGELSSVSIEPANTPLPPYDVPSIDEVQEIKPELAAEQRVPAPEPPQWLLNEIDARRVVPFVGAGLSIAASSKLPDLSDLIAMLADKLPLSDQTQEHIHTLLAMQQEEYALDMLKRNATEQERYRVLRAILNPVVGEGVDFSPPHTFLNSLDFTLYITTNYDRLLEQFLFPQPEVITASDTETLLFLMHEKDNKSRYILKLHGDITRPETIIASQELMEELRKEAISELSPPAQTVSSFLQQVFASNTVLFLGSSVSDREGFYRLSKQLAKRWGSPRKTHLALVPQDPERSEIRIQLKERLGIQMLEYIPDPVHSQVWEFISFLNTVEQPEPKYGERWTQFYRSRQRHEYLKRQLTLEQTAKSVRFLTPGLSNALATHDYLDHICRRTLKAKVSDSDKTEGERFVDECVVPAMTERWRNLERRLREEGLEVQALCLQTEVEKSFRKESSDPNALRILIQRYLTIIELIENGEIDLEVRLIPDLTAEDLKQITASYALIYRDEPKPFVDVAIAEASQATMNYFEIHTVQISTPEVTEKIERFERLWASALTEKQSIKLIKDLIQQYSGASEG